MATGTVQSIVKSGTAITNNVDADKDLKEKIKSRRTNELVIGVCGAVGCNLQDVVSELKDQFGAFSYEVTVVKVSSLIKELAAKHDDLSRIGPDIDSIESLDFFSRYTALQDLGNAIRDKFTDDTLATQAIKFISANRQVKMNASGDAVPPRAVYIVDQLKHPAEVELFRLTYRNAFFLVGVMSPQNARLEYLQSEGLIPVEAQNLVERDRKDNVTHGQQLEKTIHRSDFFVKHSLKSSGNITKPCKRFVGLVHGENGITPTRDEAGMYAAYAASLKSACLSRQVGAAIANAAGDVISVGWNDVPAGGGGLYNEDSENDQRCVVHGKKCYNDDTKQRLAKDIVAILSKAKISENSPVRSRPEKDEALHALIPVTTDTEEKKALLSSVDASRLAKQILEITALGSIIEYSRAIHAEMEAILNIARSGKSSTLGSVMYTTTYPCHNCARHIIASGISRVVYIEPYEKSLAMKLHSDAISIDESSSGKVLFENFQGVSPTRYTTLFAFSHRRKDNNGQAVRIVGKDASLISHEYLDSYLDVESKVALKGLEDSGEAPN
ncbi:MULTISPECIES: anti-phage dCTP deaminase [Pseudomonas]|uniref:anti-phage dCTP deaminase n=1 Tax=Pseudomonas TaxID=286 RepID=UPI001573128F|nr:MULTISPECIES: anti-phage dCTP deaminase [Pseudomonas]MBG6125768.1 deoxycytidylate deaminase [Pseudomonas sp. M2]NSX21009.1 deoxycytidylate deaminase [Pseudomonas putida]HDS1747318.1 deoxycytidylate deaminase [Pseudomonas putida]